MEVMVIITTIQLQKKYKLEIKNEKCILNQISSNTSGTDKLYTVVTPYGISLNASVT